MIDVSRETNLRFEKYQNLVQKWNPRINLVAASTLSDFRSRHLDDCLQVIEAAGYPSGTWLDLGSGGGLPGVVVAIAMSESPLKVILVESDQRKATFLRTVIRELSLVNVSLVCDRIETIEPLHADHLSARALAPMSKLLGMVQRHLKADGSAWLMKGRSWKMECDQARDDWRFDFTAFPSRTDPEAAILKVTGVSHA